MKRRNWNLCARQCPKAALALALATLLFAIPAAAAADEGVPVAAEALVAEALQHNPEIAAARREQEAAEQRIKPAGALEDPPDSGRLVPVMVGCCFDHEGPVPFTDRSSDALQADQPGPPADVAGQPLDDALAPDVAAESLGSARACQPRLVAAG